MLHKSTQFMWVEHFGSTYLHPKHLAYVVIVKTDAEMEVLKQDADLMAQFRALLDEYHYPKSGKDEVEFDFASSETCDREFEGNWFHYFK